MPRPKTKKTEGGEGDTEMMEASELKQAEEEEHEEVAAKDEAKETADQFETPPPPPAPAITAVHLASRASIHPPPSLDEEAMQRKEELSQALLAFRLSNPLATDEEETLDFKPVLEAEKVSCML